MIKRVTRKQVCISVNSTRIIHILVVSMSLVLVIGITSVIVAIIAVIIATCSHSSQISIEFCPTIKLVGAIMVQVCM